MMMMMTTTMMVLVMTKMKMKAMTMMATMMFVVVAVADDGGLSDVFLGAAGPVSIGRVVPRSPQSGLNTSCFDPTDRYSKLRRCLRSQCVSGDDVAKLYNMTSEEPLKAEQLCQMSGAFVYLLTSQESCSSEIKEHHESPTASAVWGYGFLFVTLINVCSTFGACVLPCINTAVYKVLLLFMVALAVGTLVGSGLLVLIPEALRLTEEDDKMYLWKATTVMGGIYLFLLVERVMRYINNRREDTKDKKERDQAATQGTYPSFFQMHVPETPHAKLKDAAHIHAQGIANCAFAEDEASRQSSGDLAALAERGNGAEQMGIDSATSRTDTTSTGPTDPSSPGDLPQEGGNRGEERVKIAPVAYMIIFGDALHNMIDGLSIGAAFTESTLLGISLSVAVMCEELPHELGDFAILLNSGMTVRKALLYNFLSSLSCYVGLIIGIQLGENTEANTWIFAIAGGMFLYISLADMLPEMNSAAESKDGKEFGEIKTFLVQNLGLLMGFGIILLLALYGDQISFE